MRRFALIFAVLLSAAPVLSARGTAKPVIGISPTSLKGSLGAADTYVRAVSLAGGIPVVLPPVSSPDEADVLIRRLDAVIMTGGEDVNPAMYGEEILNQTVHFNTRRDSADSLIIRAATHRRKPILAICRGSQILNVVLGGTLYQDIPTQLPGSVHRQPKDVEGPFHAAILEDGSLLGILFGCDTLMVNSFHHQAVKDIAPSLKVTARAADGVIESYEGDRILGVQFHPEKFAAAGDENFLSIFRALVKAASGKGRFPR